MKSEILKRIIVSQQEEIEDKFKTSLPWRQARVQDDFLANVIAGLTRNLLFTIMPPLTGLLHQ